MLPKKSIPAEKGKIGEILYVHSWGYPETGAYLLSRDDLYARCLTVKTKEKGIPRGSELVNTAKMSKVFHVLCSGVGLDSRKEFSIVE